MTAQKSFTPAFKLEIAKLMVDQNYTVKQACEAAGAGETAVKRWKQQYLSIFGIMAPPIFGVMAPLGTA